MIESNENTMKSIPKINLLIAFGTAILVAVIFFCLGFTEANVVDRLGEYKIFPSMIQTVHSAYIRYYLFLPIAVLVSLAIVFFDRELVKNASKKVLFSAVAIISLSFCWIVLTRVLQFPLCGDDSYIDFRYIRNWTENISFDYNPGERIIGFTSHIHLVLLYLVCSVFKSVDIALVSQMVNVVLQIANGTILYFFLKDILKTRISSVAGLFVYAFDPYGIQQTVFGKETHLLILFVLLCLWAMHKKRLHLVAWLSSAIPFIRPEGVIWWLVCLAWSIKNKGARFFKPYIAPSLVVLVAVLCLYLSFNSVVPHGMVGKFKMFYPMRPAFMLCSSLWMIGTGIFVPKYYLDSPGVFYALGGMILGIVTLIISFRLMKNTVFRWYLSSVLVYLVVFGIKNTASFPWYHAWYSLLPVFFLASLASVMCNYRVSQTSSIKRAIVLVFGVFLILVQLSQQVIRPVCSLAAVTFEWKNEYKRIAQFEFALNEIKKYPNWQFKTIGTPEIGYIGYRYPGKILDFCGLLSPEIIKLGRLPDEFQEEGEVFEINPKAVEKFKPDFVISLEGFARELIRDKFFTDNYERIASFDNSWANSKGLYVYRYKGQM